MMNKLKIAFFSDMLMRDYDGCMRTVFQIIDRQPDHVDMKFFTGSGTSKGLNKPVVSIPNLRIPFNRDYKVAIPQLAYFRLKKEIESYKPDIIHITTPSMLGHFALQIANEMGIPVSTIYHTNYISYVNYYLENLKPIVPIAEKILKNSTKNFYNKCDLILVPTPEMIESLSQVGVEFSKMKLWQRGIDNNVFNQSRREKNLIKNITGNNNFNLLFASRLVWEKNLRTLIRIYNAAEDKNMKLNFIIAGDGSAREELLQAMPNAHFLGNINQSYLGKIYASCDAFVFPSVSETFGNVVLEAMTSGLACVIGNGGGSKSFIKHGHNGFLCDPFEENQYIEYIQNLMTDTSLYSRIKDNAVKYGNTYDWGTLTQDYYQNLENLKYQSQCITTDKRA